MLASLIPGSGALQLIPFLSKYGKVKVKEITPDLIADALALTGKKLAADNPQVVTLASLIKETDVDTIADIISASPTTVAKIASVLRGNPLTKAVDNRPRLLG